MMDFITKFKPFVKYSIVGAIGTFLDLSSLYILVEYFYFPVILGSIVSFLLAVVNNFILNKSWTFRSKSTNYKKLFTKFLIVSIIGLGLTVASMYIFVNILAIWYILSKAITSLLVLTWNFLANKLWTFRIKASSVQLDCNFDFELSIIIPAYNEENRIKNTLLIIKDYISNNDINAEIIIVNDGSKDETKAIVESFINKNINVRLINLTKNQGKGSAVKVGVESSKGRYILFADADNSTPIEEYSKLVSNIQSKNANIAIGSRYLSQSNVKIKQPYYRVLIGRIGNFLIRLFLIDGIKDTQCGFKLFENTVAKEVFSFQKVKRFGFDMEAILVAENLGYKIIEVPVSWFNSAESRFRPIKDTLITLKDLIYIKLNLWSGRYDKDTD